MVLLLLKFEPVLFQFKCCKDCLSVNLNNLGWEINFFLQKKRLNKIDWKDLLNFAYQNVFVKMGFEKDGVKDFEGYTDWSSEKVIPGLSH